MTGIQKKVEKNRNRYLDAIILVQNMFDVLQLVSAILNYYRV